MATKFKYIDDELKKEAKPLKAGMLVSLYNCYAGYFDLPETDTSYSPEIVGMYLRTGREGQFEFYEIAVMKDESGQGGFVQRYLTSDFILIPIKE